MADNDAAYADLLPALSPLEDPDTAMLDRKATMAKLLGTDGPAAQPSWLDQIKSAQQSSSDEVAQNTSPPNLSPNGNALPPGLNSRVTTPSGATPVVPASVTQSGTPSLADGNAATIGRMQSDYAKASQDVQNEANQPDISASTKNIEASRQNAAQPINAYDPKTGKLVDGYKPSFGQRLMRGVDGFAKGGVFGAVDPTIGGGAAYGAPNAQYGRDVQQQQGRVASLDQQLKNASDNWKATSERLGKIAADRRGLATMGKDVTGASAEQQTIPIKQQEADTGSQNADSATAEAYNKSPAAKAATSQSEFEAAQKQAETLGLKGTNRTLFLANGKIPDPRQATDDEIATSQATKAFTQENGHPPQTLAEYASVRAAAKGQAGGAGAAPGGPLSPAAKAVIEGRSALPPAGSRAPGAQQLRAEVFANAPEYDETKYPTYAATRKAFTSGKEGVGINSFNTALHHLDALESHIPDNTSLPAGNWLLNLGRKATGSAALKPFEADALAVSNEVEKAYKGGAITKDEYQHMHDLISENDSPKSLRSSIGEFRNLLHGKLQSYQDQWESAMPKGAVSPLQTLGKTGGAQSSADHDIVVNPEDMR